MPTRPSHSVLQEEVTDMMCDWETMLKRAVNSSAPIISRLKFPPTRFMLGWGSGIPASACASAWSLTPWARPPMPPMPLKA